MKRWIHAATDVEYNIQPGDRITVYNGTHGYANYDADFIEYFTNKNGVKMARILHDNGKEDTTPASYIIPSEYEWFKTATLDDILTKDFVASMYHQDDSIWCNKIRYNRVDRDEGMENVTGVDADIMNIKKGQPRFRVVIIHYINKHYQETRDIEDESGLSVDDPMIDEALDILKRAPEVIINYAGYQRTFKQ